MTKHMIESTQLIKSEPLTTQEIQDWLPLHEPNRLAPSFPKVYHVPAYAYMYHMRVKEKLFVLELTQCGFSRVPYRKKHSYM